MIIRTGHHRHTKNRVQVREHVGACKVSDDGSPADSSSSRRGQWCPRNIHQSAHNSMHIALLKGHGKGVGDLLWGPVAIVGVWGLLKERIPTLVECACRRPFGKQLLLPSLPCQSDNAVLSRCSFIAGRRLSLIADAETALRTLL